MTAGSAGRVRQIAGLLVPAVLALSFSQTVAVPPSGLSSLSPAHLEGAEARVTAVIAVSGDFGSPCKDHDCTHCLACCIAGGCSMLLGWLPAAAPAPAPMVGAARICPDVAPQAPDGLGLAPALPPPRRVV